MNKAPPKPVTATLNDQLLNEFAKVAVRVAQSKNEDSLRTLHGMGVSLLPALVFAVRNNAHDVTRMIRDLGVEPTEQIVEISASKGPDNYWALCGDPSKPLHPGVALSSAIREGKVSFVKSMVERCCFKVGEMQIESLGSAKRPLPREFVEWLISQVDPSEYTQWVQMRAAQYASPAVIDRIALVAKDFNPHQLAAAAFKIGNHATAQELFSRCRPVSPVILEEFTHVSYASPDTNVRSQVDNEFLRTLIERGVQAQIEHIRRFVDEWTVRKANRRGHDGWRYNVESELEFFGLLEAVVAPASRPAVLECIEHSIRTVFCSRMTDLVRESLVVECRRLFDLRKLINQYFEEAPSP